jgi:hypothetical protein
VSISSEPKFDLPAVSTLRRWRNDAGELRHHAFVDEIDYPVEQKDARRDGTMARRQAYASP